MIVQIPDVAPDQAAHYHILGLYGFVYDQVFGWLQSKEVG
jgi:hypothetical protein